MVDVFLSYSSDDLARARGVERALTVAGYEVFWDQTTPPGADWDTWIRGKLSTARSVVVLWSKNSIASANVRHEAIIARDAGKLIPVLIDPISPTDFPMGLYLVQGVRLDEWRGDASDRAFQRLVAEIAARLGQPAPSVPAVAKGPARNFVVFSAVGAILVVALTIATLAQVFRATPAADSDQIPSAPTAVSLPYYDDDGDWVESVVIDGDLPTGTDFYECEHCPMMTVIPAGSFVMGSPQDENGRDTDEGPQRDVNITRFAVGKFEVTFDEWSACVDRGGCTDNPNPGEDRRDRDRVGRAVVRVSWDDARAYVQWLSRETRQNYRLLTEAEWEYAARAGTTTAYSTGSLPPVPRGEQPVASSAANAFGLYDMQGNVWEWVQDCFTLSYTGLPTDGSAYEGSCSTRVYRGGSWYFPPESLRSASRSSNVPTHRYGDLGFRVARTLPASPTSASTFYIEYCQQRLRAINLRASRRTANGQAGMSLDASPNWCHCTAREIEGRFDVATVRGVGEWFRAVAAGGAERSAEEQYFAELPVAERRRLEQAYDGASRQCSTQQ